MFSFKLTFYNRSEEDLNDSNDDKQFFWFSIINDDDLFQHFWTVLESTTQYTHKYVYFYDEDNDRVKLFNNNETKSNNLQFAKCAWIRMKTDKIRLELYNEFKSLKENNIKHNYENSQSKDIDVNVPEVDTSPSQLSIEQKITKKEFNDRTEYRNIKGQHHREDGPAVEHTNGNKQWCINGKYHREDGPAVEYANGYKEWYINGKWHREDGPAIEHTDGTKEWRINNQLHREDGPALEYANGKKKWYIEGQQYSEDEFNKKMNIIKKSIFNVIIDFLCNYE